MQTDFAAGFVWFTAFLFSTTVHECMHAVAAWRLGDPTAYNGGQVSLSPVPHIKREPIGMLVLPLLTSLTQGWAVGWASVPYDANWAARYPRRAALMAAAGPLGNLLLALLALFLLRTGLIAEWFVAPPRVSFDSLVEIAGGGTTFLTTTLSVLLILNVFLGVFNMLPLPSFDGAAVFGLLLPETHAQRVREFGSHAMMSMLGLAIAWQLFPFITNPLFAVILRLVHPGESYY